MKKTVRINLFWKFLIAISATIILFGTINLYFTKYTVYDLFETGLNRQGRNTAISIAQRSIDPIFYNDLATLNQIVSNQKQIDSTLAYIFIINNKKEIIAHTFEQAVPQQLIDANILVPYSKSSIVEITPKNNPHVVIRDFAVPILNGNLGVIRLGLFEVGYAKSINKASMIFLEMIALFLVFGILGALFFSYIITFPLRRISKIAKSIELGTLDIQEEDFETTINRLELVRGKFFFNVTDEIDVLIYSFGEMVSRLRTAYDDLQKTQNSLFQSAKMASLGTLSAGLAHEINNPIAGIRSSIRRLSESPKNVKQNISYLKMMDDAVNKIEKVVTGLLGFTRKPDLEFKEVNVVNIIENVLMLTAYQLEKSRITVKKRFDGRDIIISASANHIEQVILNIILNSIDAIEEKMLHEPEHMGEINIMVNDRGDKVEFEIADNGIGINEQDLNGIFDPFYTQKKVRQGIGLGLAVSFSIVERHIGRIYAANNNLGGLSLIVILPKRQ
ncbi:hypothetical protein MNBD_BACTEROID01-850 [hydrothermal vent metagenome]|uniref:Histidine kinase domain-containing protein n=1 Tax=hydrothermal vent metagenome TaxID=652676 RepID=A0A3B0U147_9ZZZZ